MGRALAVQTRHRRAGSVSLLGHRGQDSGRAACGLLRPRQGPAGAARCNLIEPLLHVGNLVHVACVAAAPLATKT
eukprot:5055299-Prymnesium_polylepis.2